MRDSVGSGGLPVQDGSGAHMGLCHLELVLRGSSQTEEALCSHSAVHK